MTHNEIDREISELEKRAEQIGSRRFAVGQTLPDNIGELCEEFAQLTTKLELLKKRKQTMTHEEIDRQIAELEEKSADADARRNHHWALHHEAMHEWRAIEANLHHLRMRKSIGEEVEVVGYMPDASPLGGKVGTLVAIDGDNCTVNFDSCGEHEISIFAIDSLAASDDPEPSCTA